MTSTTQKQNDEERLPLAVGIKRYGAEGLSALMTGLRQPKFRTKQLVTWLYGRGVNSYDEMTDLPATLREQLAATEPLAPPEVLLVQRASDDTRKYLLQLADGARIEAVGLPSRGEKLTVCFSTQVGCAMGCAFCATGRLGFTRQLAPGEMLDQLLVVARDFGCRVTNAVAMGEGEPLANYDATLAALRLMNSPDGLGIGARHLTLSTCGLLPKLRRFSNEPEQFTLAVSLHSAVQTTRDLLMPAVARYPLAHLRQALIEYAEKTGRRPTMEVALINEINDTPEEIAALTAFCRRMLVHVNLLPLNPPGRGQAKDGWLQPVSPAQLQQVAHTLQQAGVETTIRRSRGADIAGACGQLAAE